MQTDISKGTDERQWHLRKPKAEEDVTVSTGKGLIERGKDDQTNDKNECR